jgi:hypothetical protein
MTGSDEEIGFVISSSAHAEMIIQLLSERATVIEVYYYLNYRAEWTKEELVTLYLQNLHAPATIIQWEPGRYFSRVESRFNQ